MKDAQTLPGADTDPDHNLLVAKMCTKLKKIAKYQKENQGRIWRSYMVNDKTCKVLKKVN
jgi:hypothetical protein